MSRKKFEEGLEVVQPDFKKGELFGSPGKVQKRAVKVSSNKSFKFIQCRKICNTF